MDRLSMSLDDLMASRAKEAKNKKPVNSGAVRNQKKQGNNRSAPYEERRQRKPEPVVRVQQPQPVQSNAPPKQQQHLSVFARLGKPPVSGTRVTFANLKESVEASDLQDLCAAIGEIKDVELTAGRIGRNSAVVLFSRRSDALTCVEKLNGMTLDGSPMEVSITGEPAVAVAPKSVFDRLQGAPASHNVRQGLFGTAMDANDEDADGNGPRFSVTLSGSQPAGRQTKLVQPFSDERPISKGLVQPFAKADNNNQHPASGGNNGGSRFLYRDEDDRGNGNERRDRGAGQQRNQSRGNSGGGPVRGRGGNNSTNHSGHDNRGGGGGRGNRGGEKAKPLDAGALDADLDAYFANRA